MKWGAILLSIFMMVLSCISCAEAAPRVDTLASTRIQANTDAENHAPAADLCSPLCICHCCPGFSLQTNIQKVSLPVFKVVTPAPAYRLVAVSNPSFSIWQPPKL